MATNELEDSLAGRPAEELLRELVVAYKELEVTNEELQIQNRELAIARETLEAERRRYRDQFDLAPNGYLVTDANGIILEANQSAARLLGVAPTDLPGKPLMAYSRGSDLSLLYGHLARLQVGEERLTWETRLLGPGEAVVDAVVTVSVAGRADSGPAALHWSIHDVTASRQAKVQWEAAREALRHSAQFPEENPNPVMRVTAGEELLYANAPARHWLATLGWKAGEELPAPVRAVVAEVSARGRPVEREAGGPGETTFWLSAVQPAGEDHVNVYGWDITARKQAEAQREAALQAVRESEEKLRTLIEILPVDVSVLDREDRVTHLNPRRARVLELPAEAIHKGSYREGAYIRPDGSPLPPDEFPLWRTQHEQQLVRNLELGAVQEDGRVVWANVNAAPLPFDDWQAIAVIVDVTEQMEAKQALERRNRELQALTEELEAYDHSVAHDLKNPLFKIVGLAGLLDESLGELEAEEPRKMLHGIVDGGQRMKEIVDSLLLLSSTRRQEVAIGPVDMGEVVAVARQELAATIQSSRAQLTWPDRWPAVRGYAPWLQRVWVNLLSNALKYGGHGAAPRIELGSAVACSAGEGQATGLVRFWVRDHGPGLTAEEQARLFVPFSRLDRPQQLGHGLGLAIVRRIVDRLGGQVGVESRPGDGCTFWFALPAA